MMQIPRNCETPVPGISVKKKKIAAIEILNSLKNAPRDAADISSAQKGSVLAWTVRTGGLFAPAPYKLYIAGKGGVAAPKDCTELFANYPYLVSITFNRYFDTSRVTKMRKMFSSCISLEELDLRGFETSDCTDMSAMFESCYALKKLDLTMFDTSCVKKMQRMFIYCMDLKSLKLDSFQTSNVTDMTGMFAHCTQLKGIDLASLDYSNVCRMKGFLYSCGMSDQDLSKLNLPLLEESPKILLRAVR